MPSVWACEVLWWWPGWCLSEGKDKTGHKSAQQGDYSTFPQIILRIWDCPSPGEEFWERCQIPDTERQARIISVIADCFAPVSDPFSLFFASTFIYSVFSSVSFSILISFPGVPRKYFIGQTDDHFRKFYMSTCLMYRICKYMKPGWKIIKKHYCLWKVALY